MNIGQSVENEINTTKTIHHRGTEGTEKSVILLTAPQA